MQTVSNYGLDPGFGLNDVDTGNLLTFPLFCLGIKGRVNKALPVLVINSGEVRTIVEARETGFLTELNVTDMSLYTPDTMIVLPAAQQLMEIAGSHLGSIFTH